MLLAADQLDGMNSREVLVIEIYLVTRASKLLAAHGPGGPAAYDCNLRHTCFSPRPCTFLSRTNPSHESPTAADKGLLG